MDILTYIAILWTFLHAVCYFAVGLLTSDNKEKEKKVPSKRSFCTQTMAEKGKVKCNQASQTDRKAPGSNWEMCKSVLLKSPASGTNSKKGNNAKKKSSNNHHKKMSHATAASRIAHMYTGEEEVYDENKKKLTKQIALDCEMVGIGDGGTESMIARVSLVNKHGFCVYDKYVKPREPVQDYRTKVSGIRPIHLASGEDFDIIQREVAEILKGRVLVGHALKYDLDVLYLSHPSRSQRDTSSFRIFRQISRGNTPSLKKLCRELLGKDIQTGEHSSVEDARAAMQLYVLYQNRWESEFHSRR